jgi:hypothetical protein
MSLPASHTLQLYRGDTFPFAARLWSDDTMTTPVDLTGVVPTAQLRADPGGALILDMVCTVEMPNVVHMTVQAADWPAATVSKARWDLQLTASGNVRTVLAGPVQIVDDVTIP